MALSATGRHDVRSISFDLDMPPWLEARANRLSVRSLSAVVRQLVRAAMDVEQQARPEQNGGAAA